MAVLSPIILLMFEFRSLESAISVWQPSALEDDIIFDDKIIQLKKQKIYWTIAGIDEASPDMDDGSFISNYNGRIFNIFSFVSKGEEIRNFGEVKTTKEIKL